jgi:hypothetical protein
MHHSLSPVRSFPLLALVASLGGCGGGGGDLPSPPLADEFGSGARLCEVLGPASWADAADGQSTNCQAPPPDHAVFATGVTIVAIDRYDETGNGAVGNYYVQHTPCAGMPYSGMTVFGPTFSPPDLRLAEDDVVDVSGILTEFTGPSSGRFAECATLPELSGTLSFRFDSTGGPQPVPVPLSDLEAYATGRQWLGMLVRVEGLTLGDVPAPGPGRYQVPISVSGVSVIDQPKITNELFDLAADGPALATGQTFKSVTGIVTYFYGFHVAPRSAADFEE